MNQSTRKKIFSRLAYVSMFVQTFLPYGLVGLTYAQEATESATISPSPIATPSITPVITPSVTPEATPSATPTPSVSPNPTISPSPIATPSITPVVTPEATSSSTPETSAESASFSENKIPLRKVGDFLKETKKQEKRNQVEGEVIVKFKKEKVDIKRTFGKVRAYIFEKKHSLDKRDEIKSSNIQVFKSKKSTEEMVKELESDPSVEYAEPNYLRYPATINTNDTHKNLLWGLDNTGQTVNGTVGANDADIDAPESWGIAEGNESVIVAVIDSGVSYNHPDLVNNMWDGSNCKDENGNTLGGCNSGYDYEDGDKTPLPTDSSHGTHIAGTIAAEKNNGKGIIGVAPETKIMAIKTRLSISEIVKGIDFAIQNGAKIINASFGDNSFSQSEYDAINRFQNAGGIFVAATMNDSSDNDSVHAYPSGYDLDNIISVAATDQNDDLASFSNYGATSVDVGAPGVNIYSTVADIAETVILNETFESLTPSAVPSGWVKNGDWGTYELGGSWGNVLYGDIYNFPYAQTANSTIVSSSYNLSGALKAKMDFWVGCDTEYKTDGWYDYMQLEYSSDGVNFSPAIDPYYADDFRWDEPYLDQLNGDSNQSGSANYHFTDLLLPNSYLTSDFKFQFRWVANGNSDTGGGDGCKVDDVQITKYTLGDSEKYDYMDGTSMATPHVAGLVALIWGYKPNLTLTQVKDRVLQTGDPIDSLDGKTVTGKKINAYSALLSLESPTITGLDDDLIPAQSKTWNWNSTDATDTFRYLIDQTENSVPSGLYGSDKTATQPNGNGTYYLHVQAKSDVGVESAVTTVSAVLDNTASVMNITSPLLDAVVGGSSVVEFSNTEDVNSECSVNNSDWVSCTSEATVLGDITGFDSLLEGAFSFYVRDTDIAGNVGSDTETGIVKDSVAPTGSITNPANSSIFALNPSFTASASDTNGVVSVKFQYKASGTGSFTDLNIDTSTPFEATWGGISLVSNTTYDLQIIVEDTAGNLATFAGVSFTYDVTTPDQPVITNPSSAVTVNGDNYSIEGTAEADSSIKIYSGSNVAGSQQLSGGAIAFSVSIVLTQDATNSFEVSSTDAVGNESAKSTVSVITEDSINPGIDSYTLDNPIISPEVSVGIKDTAGIDLLFSEEVDYLISIKNSGGTTVRSWSGSDVTNPQVKVWDGKDTGESYVSNGIYTIEVIITDEADNSITDTSKTITVDNAPLNMDAIGNKTIDEGALLTFTASASNSEGDPVSYSLTNSPTGAIINSSNGIFNWTPTEAQGPGDYTLNINATSGDLSDSEEITITVNEVNVKPVANPQSVSTDEEVSKTITLSATDVDLPENDLTYSIISGPTNGTLGVVIGNQVTYTPNTNYNGSDSFTFQVDDSLAILASTGLIGEFSPTSFVGGDDFLRIFGLSSFASVPPPTNTATISITVDPVNDEPTAVTDTASVDEDQVLTIAKSTLLSNDSDIDGDPLTLTSLSNSVNGSVVIDGTDVKFTPTANYHGSASFDYTVSDGSLTDIGTVNITVAPVNDAPEAVDGSVSVVEDSLVEVTLSASDVDDTSLTYSIVDAPTHGLLDSTSDNKVTYTPEANYTGSDSFTFKANDGDLDSNTATISITVTAVNDKPILDLIGNKSIDELTTLTFTATASDPDSSLTYSLIGAPTGATIDSNTGAFSFTPTEAQGLDDYTLTVSVTDGLLTDSEEITITVNEVNQAPVAIDDGLSTNEDTAVTITLGTTDSDLPGQTLTYSIVSGVSHGTLGTISDNKVTYTPSANYTGSDSFTFKANDGMVDSNTATISITVDPVNDEPTAVADTASVDEDNVLEVAKTDLLGNDSDIDGDSINLISVSNPVNGGVVINGDNVVFTPTANYHGSASFDYTVSDGSLTDTAKVSITINPVNDNPVVNDGSVTTIEDTTVTIDLSATDIDEDDLIYSIVDGPTNGSLGDIYEDNKVDYTPNSNYTGNDSFTFKANDGTVDSNTATVSVTVSEVSDPPVLNPIGNKTVDELSTLTFTVTADDPDSTLTYSLTDAPLGATINSDTGVFSFTPSENQGPNVYILTVNVTDGISTDSEEITITVNEVNQVPVALDDGLSTNEDTEMAITLESTDSDSPTQTLTYSIVSGVSHGVLENISGSQLTYTPTSNYTGSDSFTFKVNDGVGDSNTATISITVNPVNDEPTAVADTVSVDEDNLLTIAKSDLLNNDFDIDRDALNLVSVSNPVQGSVVIDGDNVVFTPTANYHGSASFDYTISDGSLTDTATVSITVNPVNDDPVANDGSATTTEDTTITIDLSANDIDGDSLTYSIVTGVSNGTLGDITGNQVDYTPNSDYTGSDSFTFKANDSTTDSNTATVSVTVNPPPVISSETTNIPSTTSITVTWTTDHPSTSRVIYDVVSRSTLDVAPNYGYANSTIEIDNSPKVTSHSVTINGLQAGITYYYRVVSHGSPEVVGNEKSFTTENETSGEGEVAGTSVSSSSTDSPVCSNQKPDSAPVLMSVISNKPNEATLIWEQAKDPVTYYLIAFGTSSGEMLYGNPNVGGRGTTTYTVDGLSSGTRYYFKVRAGNNCMPGDYSNEISIRVSGESLSEIPEGFSPGVLGEETTAVNKVLGEDTVSPTSEIFPKLQTQSNRNLLKILVGLGVILIGISYIFLAKRKKNKS